MSKKTHSPPRDPFVFVILHMRESKRNVLVEKAERAGVPFKQWAMKALEDA